MKPTLRQRLIKPMAYSALVLTMIQPALSIQTVFANPSDVDGRIQVLEEERMSVRELLDQQEVSLDEVAALIKEKEESIMVIIAEIEEKEAEIAALHEDIATKEVGISNLEKEIKKVEQDLEEKLAFYEENVTIAKERAQNLQKEEKSNAMIYIEAISKSESLTDVFGRIRAINTILGAHNDFIEDIETQALEIESIRDGLNKDKKSLIDERDKLKTMQDEASKERKQLEKEKERVTKLGAELQKEQKELEKAYTANVDELATIEENIDGQRLLKEMLEAEAKLAEEASFASLSSSDQNTLMNSLERIRHGRRDPEIVQEIITEASEYIGVPYVWGGATPSGFDCSGLVQYVYEKAGISLPRVSRQQAAAGSPISISEAQPGDLLFWDKGGRIYHVAIYIGGGDYIHAPRPGKSVTIESVRNFTPSSARRVIPNERNSDKNNTFASVTTKIKGGTSASSVDSGELIGTFQATSYAIGDGLTPSTVTANGTNVANTIYSPEGHRIIAADTSILPMNTVVRVVMPNGTSFTAKVSDTGSAINGNIIDLLTGSVNEARAFGRQSGIRIYSVN